MLQTNYGGFAVKSKNETEQDSLNRDEDEDDDRDDLDTSLNRDPFAEAGMTKMTGFNIMKSQGGEDTRTVQDLIAEGVQLPKLLQEADYEPIQVHDELIKENAVNSTDNKEFEDSFKQMDLNAQCQVFNAPNMDPETSLDIKIQKSVGSGS